MDMLSLIDWRMVFFSGLWISGLVLILTALGLADYQAVASSGRFREIVRRPGYRVAINAGLTLFCSGLLGSSRSLWEGVLWGLLAAGFLAYTAMAWRPIKKGQGS